MNYKIRKLEGGGAMVATYTPMARQDTTAPSGVGRPSSDKTSESSDDLKTVIDKKIYERLISEGGLINDVNYFLDKLSGIGGGSQLPYLDNKNISGSLQTIKDLNKIQQYSKLWDTTYATAKELGGLGEVAVGKSGEVFVKDGKTFKSITLKDYAKHKDKYNPLTVAELLRARRHDPNLVYNDSIFQVGEVAHGTKEILTKVDNIIKLVHADEIKTERHYSRQDLENQLEQLGAVKAPTAQQKAQVSKLAEMLQTPGDQIKRISETSSKRDYKSSAYDYILSSLTKEEKLKLNAVATIGGVTIESWLQDALTVGLSGEKNSETIDGESPVETHASKAAKEENGAKSLSGFQLFHKGKLYDPNATFSLNDPQWDSMFRGTMESVGPLMTSKDQIIGTISVGSLLNEANYGMFLNGNQVYFGDKKVSIVDKNNVIMLGDDAAKVYMPVKNDGSPDYESLEKFKDVYAIYEANKENWSTKTAMEHFRKANYNLVIDQVGNEKVIRENSRIKPFLVTHGYTNNGTDLVDNNKWIKDLTDEEEDGIVPMLRQYWTVGTGKNQVDLTPEAGFWSSTQYSKGLIAIPYRDTATAYIDSLSNQGPKDIVSNINDVQNNITQSAQVSLNRQTSAADLNR